MIQDIEPKCFDVSFRECAVSDSDYILHYEGDQVMLKREGGCLAIPTAGALKSEGQDAADQAEYLFSIDGRAYFCAPQVKLPASGAYELQRISVFRTMEPLYQAFAGITGSQIYRFRESRRFCGRCGMPMRPSRTERAMVCAECGQVEYPKISPAVIVAVRNGDRLLLSKYARGTYRRYALIAGFVEVGETFEDCVRREVMEEVGLKVKNIRYYKSQPWAFSDTEMVGFTAELDGDDRITLEEDELSEAGWFTRDEITDYAPSISIGGEMVAAFKDGRL